MQKSNILHCQLAKFFFDLKDRNILAEFAKFSSLFGTIKYFFCVLSFVKRAIQLICEPQNYEIPLVEKPISL